MSKSKTSCMSKNLLIEISEVVEVKSISYISEPERKLLLFEK